MSQNYWIIAIDPGANGGIVFRDASGRVVVDKMPATQGDIVEHLKMIHGFALGDKIVVVMEKVCGFCGQKQPGAAMFKFGEGYGLLQGVIMGMGLRLELVTPQTWQKTLGLGTHKGMNKTQWKNKLKAEAQRLYPQQKVTLATADALLILEYAIKTKGIETC